jgi:hypothetical protein
MQTTAAARPKESAGVTSRILFGTCNVLRHNRNGSTLLQLSDFHDYHDTSKTSDAPRQHAPRISRSHAVAQYLLAPTSVQR